ncbi:DUF5994 family protein [Streptomyces sp. BA2]|uniref:DUF5994 family protein n=1 Tax=Streptomyces sp. BA2 TaxID=436595 RepID=UPI001F37808C|nr:DUF5994 family protein [Streptomyces sp. BA2]
MTVLTARPPPATPIAKPSDHPPLRLSVKPAAPRKVPVNGHVVNASWFRAQQDVHQLLVLSYHVGRWDLLIIPPETGAAAAARLMAAACDPSIVRTGSAIIADELDRHPAAAAEADPPGRTLAEAWEAEGGAMDTAGGTVGGR